MVLVTVELVQLQANRRCVALVHFTETLMSFGDRSTDFARQELLHLRHL
jgi:hypothetical protein